MSIIILKFLVFSIVASQCSSILTCKHKLKPLGCFKDNGSGRAMPEQILNEREWKDFDKYSKDIASVLNEIEWKDFDKYLPKFICRCAEAASKKGYKVFGVQFWGECWSGPNAESTFNKYGEVDSCVNKHLKKNKPELSQCVAAAGTRFTNFVYRIAPDCQTKYEPVGCFRDKQNYPRPIPNYISTDRDISSNIFSGKVIKWKNWNTHSKDMICRCAVLAKSKGHQMFSLQFWGDCWSGPESNHYRRDGSSNNCRGKDFKKCLCNSYQCVGKAQTNYVYRLS